MSRSSNIGISFSDEAINVVLLSKKKDNISLINYGEKKLPYGVIKNGTVKDLGEVAKALRFFRDKEGRGPFRVTLPEMEDNTFADNINDWKEVFREGGISVKSFESEGQTLVRTLIKRGDNETRMILKVDDYSTDIFITDLGRIVLFSTLATGGKTLIKVTEEESVTKDISLDRNIIVSEIASSSINGISVLREEISRQLLYWHTRPDKNGSIRPKVSEIMLCGSSAHIKGLDEYLAVSLKMRVKPANVWTNIFDTNKNIPEMTFKESFSYASALGAALGGF